MTDDNGYYMLQVDGDHNYDLYFYADGYYDAGSDGIWAEAGEWYTVDNWLEAAWASQKTDLERFPQGNHRKRWCPGGPKGILGRCLQKGG